MQPPTIEQINQQQLTCPQLPLAVYREVVAHLRQVDGVEAELILRSVTHIPGEKFDYYQSQVSALQISYLDNVTEDNKMQVQEILNYYASRYRSWEVR